MWYLYYRKQKVTILEGVVVFVLLDLGLNSDIGCFPILF